MREYSPGASMNDDYAYGCDTCKAFDGRKLLIWRETDLIGENRSHFAICLECIEKLYFQYVRPIDKELE